MNMLFIKKYFYTTFVFVFYSTYCYAQMFSTANNEVIYFSNTETEFIGEVRSFGIANSLSDSKANPSVLNIVFSSVEKDDGIDISIKLNGKNKEFYALVNSDYEIMEMKSRDITNGDLVNVTTGDKEELKIFRNTIKLSYKADKPVRQKFGTFINFLINETAEEEPVNVKYYILEKGYTPTGQRTINYCSQVESFSSVNTLPRWFKNQIKNWVSLNKNDKHSITSLLNTYLSGRNWEFIDDDGKDKNGNTIVDYKGNVVKYAICGFTYNTICDKVGNYDHASITTYPISNPHSNRIYKLFTWLNSYETQKASSSSYIGAITAKDNTEKKYSDLLCVGRCGPGCFDTITSNWVNNTHFTYTKECFAHDLCINDVNMGNDDTYGVYGGKGDACLDEFLNAGWGVLNGATCNDSISYVFEGSTWSIPITGAGTFDCKLTGKDASNIKGKTITCDFYFLDNYQNHYSVDGEYVINTNTSSGYGSGKRYIQIHVDSPTGVSLSLSSEFTFVGEIQGNDPSSISGQAINQNNITSVTMTKMTLADQ